MDLNRAMVNLYKQRSNASSTNHSKQKVSEETIAPLDLKPKTTFEQLFGIESEREKVSLIVNEFKRASKGDTKESCWPILVCGSRGLGKTALVEAAANCGELNLITIQLRQMVELTRNDFRESLAQLECHCINNQPAVVLIENLEEIVDKDECRLLIRGAVRRLLANQLKLLVFCTTSSTLDGLSDIEFCPTIYLKRPNSEARFKMLKSLLCDKDNLSVLTDDCLQVIATETPSFTASDLRKMLYIARYSSGGELTLKHCKVAIEEVKRTFKRGTHLIGEKPTVTWNDIGGMIQVKKKFSEIIRQADMSCKFSGIALYGPPGCGKTMVAKAMANEAGFNFISIKPGELVDKFLGETEKNIRRVFQEAQEHEPCIIYFDEFDGLCGTRGDKSTLTGAIQTLLSEMDGFIDRGQSIVMVSTNRPEDIDPAMMRPGRLSEHIYVGPPDQAARREILSVITNKPSLSLAPDVDLDMWAAGTNSFTGAELNHLIDKAKTKAISELDDGKAERVTLRQEHFLHAINEIHLAKRRLGKKTKTRSKRTRSFKRPKIE